MDVFKMMRDNLTFFLEDPDNLKKDGSGYWYYELPDIFTLYHGSSTMVTNNIEVPVGRPFYEPVNTTEEKLKIIRLNNERQQNDYKFIKNIIGEKKSYIDYLSSFFQSLYTTDPSWFGDSGTAQLYSSTTDLSNPDSIKRGLICDKNCILSFSLIKPLRLFAYHDKRNHDLIFKDANIPDEQKQNLAEMFYSNYPYIEKVNFRDINVFSMNINRVSYREYDIPFAKWMCENILSLYGFDGIAAPKLVSTFHSMFHLEIILCNAQKCLKRNYDDPYDWQYNDMKGSTNAMKIIEQMKLYENINSDAESGNLYEKSVWSVLWSETLLEKFSDIIEISDPRYNKLMSFFSFIYQLGALNTVEYHHISNKKDENFYIFINNERKKMQYFLMKNYEYVAENMINENNINLYCYVYDKQVFEICDRMSLDELFDAFDIKGIFNSTILRRMLILCCVYHNDLYRYYEMFNSKEVKGIPDFESNVIVNYLSIISDYFSDLSIDDGIKRNILSFATVLLVIVSLSCILSKQPYLYKLEDFKKRSVSKSKLNKKSKYFPFITNISKKVRGNSNDITNVIEFGIKIILFCYNKLA